MYERYAYQLQHEKKKGRTGINIYNFFFASHDYYDYY